MKSLFVYCTSVVLGSPYLLERASLHLPRKISYFLLYLALESRNQLAVKKLVEKWPHTDLVLDFLSESSLCRRHRCATSHCLEPHEYMGVFGSYARYSRQRNVSSLLEGVFYNMLSYSSSTTGDRVGLRFLDMSDVIINVNQVPLLLNLVNGRVPVIHLCDYVNDREAEILGLSRPQLSRPQLSCSPLQPPVSLHVNLMLDDTATKPTIDALVEICSHRQWVEVKLKGLNILGLNPAVLKKFQLNFNALMSPIIDHVYLTGACFRELKEIQSISSTLWVSCDASLPTIPGNCINILLASHEGNNQLTKTLHELSTEPQCLQAFCIMQQGLELTDALSAALSIFLQTVSGSLEYLQLQRWSFTSTDLKSLLQCTKLRVLSITEECLPTFTLPKRRASDIFTAISELPYLEFFQWSESLNLVTADLLSLRHLLRDSLRSLNHFHIGILWLHLSTTDLENESYSPLGEVLLPLLSGKEGSDMCSTYRFSLTNDRILEWLSVLRPQVCFRVGWKVKEVTELHKAATVYDHLY